MFFSRHEQTARDMDCLAGNIAGCRQAEIVHKACDICGLAFATNGGRTGNAFA
jgi:hypothetical protein